MDDEVSRSMHATALDAPGSSALFDSAALNADRRNGMQGSLNDPKERNNAMTNQLPKNISLEEFTESVFGSVLRAVDTHQKTLTGGRENLGIKLGPIIFGYYLDVQGLNQQQFQGFRSRSVDDTASDAPDMAQP